ncbi:MAG: carboxypeptidase M32, partial [Ferruginibacter sp.]
MLLLIMTNSATLYEEYKKTMQRIADIKYSSAVLQWDQETYLPPKSSYFRNRQITTLNELAHDAFINRRTGDLLSELSKRDDLSISHKRNIDLTVIDYNRALKLSTEFVGKLSNAISRAYHSWMDARKANSFTIFESSLNELVELKQQEAEMLGYINHPYNALLNDYDKGLTVTTLDNLFSSLQPKLVSILNKIQSLPPVDDSFLKQHFPKDVQWAFGLNILKDLNFDFNHGRQDLSEHPFTTNFSSKDVRITTRIDEND